jgi:CheY-like chemotaxis protein
LVLSTIHTNTAPAAITRLLDLNVAPFSIAASVGGVVAQRLVRRLCPECKRILTEKERQDLEVPATITGKIYCAQGCSKCEKSGYHGRLGVFSLFDVTPELSDAIRAGRSELELIDIAKKGGYQSLGEAALALIQEGETSISEFERVIGPFEVVGQSSSTAVFVPRQTNEQTGQLSKPRILLVEDDEDTRTVLKMFLERDLFEVIEAADGQAALQLVYNSPPDIILSDVMMPRVNGFELLQRLKADSRTSKIPVLMLTANESEEVELRLIASGAKDFVGKTSRHDVLIARIRRLLPTE